MCFIGLSFSAVAQANQTTANDDGAGNVVFFDRHVLNCGQFGMRSMHLIRPSYNQIAFNYQCQQAGESTSQFRMTTANDDGGGNMVYLDRHGVDCYNKPLQYVHLTRPSGNQISYHYKCGANDLSNISDHYTPSNDDGGGNAVFLDRHNMSCPAGKVMSFFRLFRPSDNTISYHYKCGIPHTDVWQEIRVNGMCLDGSLANHNDNVYLHPCHGGNNQKWQLDNEGLLRSRANPNLCIDLIQTFKFPNSVSDARLNYCDAGMQTQRFNYSNNRLSIVLYDQTLYLGTYTYSSSDMIYQDQNYNGNRHVSFESGATQYNVDPFNYLADVLANDTLRQFAAAFQVNDLKVEKIDIDGTSIISGKVRSVSNSSPLGLAVKGSVNMRKYLLNDDREDVPFKILLTNQGNNNFEAKIRFELVRGWREINPQSPIGTQFIFKDADLVLTATYQNGEKNRTIGVDGHVYIKPTPLDNWLYTNPSVTRNLGADPSNDYAIVIKGACTVRPHQNTVGQSECNTDWNILNANILTAASESNGGYNYLQITMVGSNPNGGKVKFDKGQFLNTANLSGEWQGDEDGSQGKAYIQLNGLDQKLRETISENAFVSWTGGSTLLSGSYSVDEVYVTKASNSPANVHVKMHVLGEPVEVIYTPQSQAETYLKTAQANEDLLRAVAKAIARVIVEKSGLGTLIDLADSALQVVGIRGGTQVFFSATGQAIDQFDNVLDGAGNVIGTVGGGIGDVICFFGIC